MDGTHSMQGRDKKCIKNSVRANVVGRNILGGISKWRLRKCSMKTDIRLH
jgi:hypothetical protein